MRSAHDAGVFFVMFLCSRPHGHRSPYSFWPNLIPRRCVNRFGEIRRNSPFYESLYTSGNVLGIASNWPLEDNEFSPVRAKESYTYGNERWTEMEIEEPHWAHCLTGPFFLALILGASFSGCNNLSRYDEKAAGLRVGLGGYLSTPRTSGG